MSRKIVHIYTGVDQCPSPKGLALLPIGRRSGAEAKGPGQHDRKEFFPLKGWRSSAERSGVAGKPEVADAGIDPGFCVVRVRAQRKPDQHQIPASIGTVQV